MIYRLDALSVVDLVGKDADKILHNLTTNHVKALEPATGCETFVTDARGKMLGHVMAYRTDVGYRLIGAGGQSERIVAHADRYTIREDALPSVLDDSLVGLLLADDFVVPGDKGEVPAASAVGSAEERVVEPAANAVGSLGGSEVSPAASGVGSKQLWLAGHAETAYEVTWLGGRDLLLLIPIERVDAVVEQLTEAGNVIANEAEFHRRRTLAGEPWLGIDLDETHLPQEADRNAKTICFTKGCYLGQETIARLDALGQVQKKLILWKIDGAVPAPGTTLVVDDKPVARLTSVAVDDEGQCYAIAMTRRSHFAKGAKASGADLATGALVTGDTVH